MAGGRSKSDGNRAVEDTTKAAMVWLCLSCVIILLLFILYWWKNKSEKKRPARAGIPGVQTETGALRAQTAGGVRRRPRTARQRMMTRRQDYEDFDDDANENPGASDGSDNEAPLDGTEQAWQDDAPSGKIGTKKLKKLQEKAMKKEQRELEQQEREERKKQEELRKKEREEEAEKQRLLEEREKEEEQRLKEEQERKDHEEYLLLKEAFTVDEEGESGILSDQESQALLQEFIDFVKRKKIVTLEELASHFDLRVQDAINRLEDLQEMGRLTGVMDDRGKFIFVSQQELEAVARYVKQRGRVAITELAEASSTLISLKSASSDSKTSAIEVSSINSI